MPSTSSGSCMSFEEFAELCGVSKDPSPSSNGLGQRRRPGENDNDVDQTFRRVLDERVNEFQEDLQEQLEKTKLAMKMNFTVQLERLRVRRTHRERERETKTILSSRCPRTNWWNRSSLIR